MPRGSSCQGITVSISLTHHREEGGVSACAHVVAAGDMCAHARVGCNTRPLSRSNTPAAPAPTAAPSMRTSTRTPELIFPPPSPPSLNTDACRGCITDTTARESAADTPSLFEGRRRKKGGGGEVDVSVLSSTSLLSHARNTNESVAHVNESYHLFAYFPPHVWMSHVSSYGSDVSHMICG